MRNQPTIKEDPVPQREQHALGAWEQSRAFGARTAGDGAAVAQDGEFLDVKAGAGGVGVDACVEVLVGVRVLVVSCWREAR